MVLIIMTLSDVTTIITSIITISIIIDNDKITSMITIIMMATIIILGMIRFTVIIIVLRIDYTFQHMC